jgi:hypothetical protein
MCGSAREFGRLLLPILGYAPFLDRLFLTIRIALLRLRILNMNLDTNDATASSMLSRQSKSDTEIENEQHLALKIDGRMVYL